MGIDTYPSYAPRNVKRWTRLAAGEPPPALLDRNSSSSPTTSSPCGLPRRGRYVNSRSHLEVVRDVLAERSKMLNRYGAAPLLSTIRSRTLSIATICPSPYLATPKVLTTAGSRRLMSTTLTCAVVPPGT